MGLAATGHAVAIARVVSLAAALCGTLGVAAANASANNDAMCYGNCAADEQVAMLQVHAQTAKGCVVSKGFESGEHTITVTDPLLGEVERHFLVVLPSGDPPPGQQRPLLIGFHGQGQNPSFWRYQNAKEIVNQAVERGYAVVLAGGYRETPIGGNNPDTTWNEGSAGDDNTCVPEVRWTQCMPSCQRLNKCGKCNWASCYDDTAFIRLLLERLEVGLCLDRNRFFAFAESNGAMFLHHLLSELPGVFLAAIPIFGSPLLGYSAGSDYGLVQDLTSARRTSVLQIHGRQDVTIPLNGGKSADGWLYERMDRTLGTWAAMHGCRRETAPAATQFQGGSKGLLCEEFQGCSHGHVMYCTYNGVHGSWPDEPRGARLMLWFYETVEEGTTLTRGE